MPLDLFTGTADEDEEDDDDDEEDDEEAVELSNNKSSREVTAAALVPGVLVDTVVLAGDATIGTTCAAMLTSSVFEMAVLTIGCFWQRRRNLTGIFLQIAPSPVICTSRQCDLYISPSLDKIIHFSQMMEGSFKEP